jgi:hypothetical protein
MQHHVIKFESNLREVGGFRIKAYKTSLILPLFIKLPVPNQGSELSCVCVLEVSMYQSREVNSHVFVC